MGTWRVVGDIHPQGPNCFVPFKPLEGLQYKRRGQWPMGKIMWRARYKDGMEKRERKKEATNRKRAGLLVRRACESIGP